MVERLGDTPEYESQPALDQGAILDKLFELREEIGLDVEEGDLRDLMGEDDNDFLGNLATLALEHGVDHEEMFELLGISTES